jgi:hypothetical protein
MNTATRKHASALPSEPAALFLIAALGAVVSLIATGHTVGVRNDIYFQPILAALYDEPQFANDAYVQSLHYYSSGLWQLLSGLGADDGRYWLLLSFHFASRLLTFLGFLACATLLGVRSLPQRLFLTALICMTSFLRGQSIAGDGGLFINYFTHSEIDNGLTLLMLYMVLRGWLVAAIATDGVVFFINAFIGAWDAVMIVGVASAMAFRGAITWRRFFLHGLMGTVLAAIPALPILRNIFANPDFGRPTGFDYLGFLEDFWPYHFLFRDIGWIGKAGLGTMIALGGISFVALGRRSFFFLTALASFVLVYTVGISLPYLTHSATVLNLHLLRVSTMLHLLVMLGALTVATRWWFSDKPLENSVFAPVLVLLLCIPIKMTTVQPVLHAGAAFLLIAASLSSAVHQKIPDQLSDPKLRLRVLACVILIAGFTVATVRNTVSAAHAERWLSEWKALAQWARSNTAPSDVFLLPTWNFQGSPSLDRTTDDTDAILNSGGFEAYSHRAVWIDFRQGAAVMWSPSYYELWHRRVAEVNNLTSDAAKDQYAKDHSIKYMIELCHPDAARPPIFSTAHLCIYGTS